MRVLRVFGIAFLMVPAWNEDGIVAGAMKDSKARFLLADGLLAANGFFEVAGLLGVVGLLMADMTDGRAGGSMVVLSLRVKGMVR